MAKKKVPYDKEHGRDYKSDYQKFQSSDEQKKDRASRNAARAKMEKQVGKEALKNKDISHENGNPRDNRKSNLKVEAKSKNRARK